MRIHSAKSVLEVTIREADDGAEAVTVRTENPTDADEWVSMPGAKRGLRSLSLDAPGFTVIFDGASELSDADADLTSAWAGDEEGADEANSGVGGGSFKLDLLSTKIVRQGKKG